MIFPPHPEIIRHSDWTIQLKHERLKRMLQPMAGLMLRGLCWLESKLWANVRLHYSPVFIVAPPRSGTTLLYQLMTGCLATSYFTNLAMRISISNGQTAPLIGAQLVKLLKLSQSSGTDFESHYGATKGWAGPNEGATFWRQWFPQQVHAIPAGVLSIEAQKSVYRAVAGTERVFDRPFVNKRIMNSVRIEALNEIFPTAIFIHCIRNPVDVAQSIFIARTQDFPFQKELRDPVTFWISVRPKEYEIIKQKSLLEQVCEQVYYVEQSIMTACKNIGQDRFLSISYQDLCQSPHREIGRVADFMNQHRAPTCVINPIPDSFPYSSERKVDQATYSAIVDYLSQIYAKSMTGR